MWSFQLNWSVLLLHCTPQALDLRVIIRKHLEAAAFIAYHMKTGAWRRLSWCHQTVRCLEASKQATVRLWESLEPAVFTQRTIIVLLVVCARAWKR